MNLPRLAAGLLLLPLFLSAALAQAPNPLPVLDGKPVPQVDARGPSAAVTSMAFSTDGKTLYAAGLDKVVRVWKLQKNKFVLQDKDTYRVPLGPGNIGALNAVALSPDGVWVAMAGRAPISGEAGFRHTGLILDPAALTPDHNRDLGVIYVANTANPGGGKVLRDHRGAVKELAFAAPVQGQPALLVSAAIERDGAKRFGGLRLWQWDAAKGEFKLLAERNGLPPTADRPGLAVWRTGPGERQVRVAVSWPKAQKWPFTKNVLYVWEVDNARLVEYPSDPFTETVQLLSQSGKILTGGLEVEAKPGGLQLKGGRLREWDLKAELISTVVTFPSVGQLHFLPRRLTMVSPSHAAVVLQPSPRANYRLALVDLKAGRTVVDMPLANSDLDQLPAIAASRQHLAVAATRDRGIRVYAVADLLQGKKVPFQDPLRGAGLTLRQLAFVEKGAGIWFAQVAGKPLNGGWVFDLNKRQFRENNVPGLAADTPVQGTWEVEWDEKSVTVMLGKKAMPPVRLPKGVRVTKAKLRPAAQGLPDVLAVAYTEKDANRPLIALYNPADGKPYRLLAGHLQDVLGLAFSASRPLLASVGDDQTVCVWSLADIRSEVAEVSGLGVGNQVGKNGNEVVVRSVEAGSPAAVAKLVKGDVLEKVGAPGGKARAIKDAVDFLLDVSQRKPGGKVEVTVVGKVPVTLPLQRGVDWRNPLFSLFLKANLDWVGWSPVGPYDCKNAAAEAHLGWHTNTGDRAAPVSYVAAAAYRKDFYKKGILRYLAEEADLGPADKKWKKDNPPPPPPKPAVYLIRPDGAVPDPQPPEFLVRQPVKDLRVGINPEYQLTDEHVLRWRLLRIDGKTVKGNAKEVSGIAERDGQEWEVALPGVDWRRGEYRVLVDLHERGNAPVLDWSTILLRFQPPAPQLYLSLDGEAVSAVLPNLGASTLGLLGAPTGQGALLAAAALNPGRIVSTTKEKPLVVPVNQLTLQVQVEPSVVGQEVKVQFEEFRNGLKDNKTSSTMNGKGQLKFALQEGLNRLVVYAINKDALAGQENEEKKEEVWVRFKAPLQPLISSLQLNPADPNPVRLDGKEVWVVSKPNPVLTGKVEPNGEAVEARWFLDDGKPQVLRRPDGKILGPNGGKFEVQLQVKDLAAGEPKLLRLAAKSKNSPENQVPLWLVFHPLVPDITPTQKIHDELKSKVVLKGTFGQTKFPPTLRFQVRSSEGKVDQFQAEVNEKAGTWEVNLQLFPGSNTVEAFVKNNWRGERPVLGELKLSYLRPPRITDFPKNKVMAVDTNRVKLELTVESPADRPLSKILVDGQSVAFDQPKRDLLAKPKGDYLVWKVVVPEVCVNFGENPLKSLSVQAVNGDGSSAAVTILIGHVKTPPVPRASFISPEKSDTASQAKYSVTFRVESELPLERVEITGGAQVVTLKKEELEKAKVEGKVYILKTEVVLNYGFNTLKLEAVNTKWSKSVPAEAVVSYPEPAVRIQIDRIEVKVPGKQILVLRDPNGGLKFDPAPSSLVWLAGRVRWSNPKAEALDKPGLKVVVKVGDCRQFPVQLEDRGKGDSANDRKFLVPVVLIGKTNNIKIEIPSLPKEALSSDEFALACARPASLQRLHVLIIGVNVKNADLLKKRVLDALGVENAPGDRPTKEPGNFLRKPPFDQCILYSVLAGEVNKAMVLGQLDEINRTIRRLDKETKYLNDLVLIYYQGEDWQPEGKIQGENKRWLKMSQNLRWRSAPVEDFALPCQEALARVQGAPLLLLNVTGKQTKVVGTDWGGDPDTGFLRYAMAAAEVGKADPALLRGLQKATGQKNRLGEVVDFLKDNLDLHPLVVLNQDQQNRQISEAKKKAQKKP